MLLSIQGFRSIKEYECEIQPESITLISGPSGIGKTTLLNAIYWCLYGSLKNVRKFGSKTGQCRVQIKFGYSKEDGKETRKTGTTGKTGKTGTTDKDNVEQNQSTDPEGIRITRSKSPDSIVFEELGKIVLKDDEAQEKINQLFGTQDIWLASCYLRQGTRNKFLESSPSERLAFLSELCFSSEGADSYLDKIDEKCKSMTKEFERQNDFYKRDLEEFQKKRKQYPQYKNDILSETTKNEYQNFIQSDNLLLMEKDLSFAERTESSIDSLEQTKLQWIQSLPKYKEYLLSMEHKKLLERIVNENIESSPKKLLLILEQEIQQLEKIVIQLDIWQSEYLKLSKEFFDQFNQQPEESELSEDEIQTKKENLKNMENKLEYLMKGYLENENKKGQLQIHKTRLEHLYQELLKLEEKYQEDKNDQTIWSEQEYLLLLEKVEKNRLNHQKLEEKQRLENEWNHKVSKSIDILNDQTIESRKISNEEIKYSLSCESNLTERNKYLEQLDVLCDKNSIQKAIEIRKKICQVQDVLEILTQLQKLEEELNGWDEKINLLGKRKDWISEQELPKRILELESNKDLLQCPKCSSSLRYDNHQLVECQTIPKEKIESLSKWIELSKNRIEWMKERQKVDDQLNENFLFFQKECEKMNMTQDEVYQYPKLENEEKQKLWLEIQTLEKYLPSFDLSFESSERLDRIQRKWELEEWIKETKDRIENIIIEEQVVEISLLEKQKDEYKRNLDRWKDIQEQIQCLQKTISDMDWKEDITKEKWEEYQSQYESEKQTFIRTVKANEILALKKKIQNQEETKNILGQKKNELESKWSEFEQRKKEWDEAKECLALSETAEKIEDLEQKIITLKQSLSRDSGSIRNELCLYKQEIEQKKEQLIRSEKAEAILKEKIKLENQRMEVIQLSNRVSTISKLKMLGNELEHKRMLSILDTINDFTNEMLTILFDEPIKIEFSVYKTTKTKEKVKPSIVYKIFYKGFELDHVDQLSGGEADRVSLALTCALFQFTKFPYLLLDEFASSLDLNTKEMAIKTLKTFLGIGMNQHKSIVCISHDTVEGIYDYSIKL